MINITIINDLYINKKEKAMKTLSAVLLSVVLMSSNLFAQNSNLKLQDSNSKVEKLTPELKEKISKNLQGKQKIVNPMLQRGDRSNADDNSKENIIEPTVNHILGGKSLNEIKHLKKPPTISPEVQMMRDKHFKKRNEKKSPQLQSQMTQLPQNIRYIGEFEESQAVMVAVPCEQRYRVGQQYYYPFAMEWDEFLYYVVSSLVNHGDISLSQGQAFYNEYANMYWEECEPGDAIFWPWWEELSDDLFDIQVISKNNSNLVWFSYFNYSNTETQKYIWSNLINAIQQEAQVWIRMTAIQDTTVLKNYMAQNGMPLTNYRFFNAAAEDAFWARDYGPHGFYYNDNGTQKLGFHDALYYTGRPFDDVFPRKLLDETGYNWYDLQIKMEGGNLMTDGYGDATYGDVIYNHNDTIYYQSGISVPKGQYTYDYQNSNWYISDFKPLKKNELDAKMKQAFNLNNPNLVRSLRYDGGTGHIDLWVKQFDEESLLIANMPEKYSGLADYKIIQQNRQYLSNKTTTFGTKYRFLNAPMPKSYNYLGGDTNYYPPANGDMPLIDSNYNKDPRGYLNGLVVNKSYIYPSFSRSASDACWQSDREAEEILKKLLPGYKLVPIDSRWLTPRGGAIHCITMQIPQEPSKVITIKHKPIRDDVGLSQSFNISAELISNTDANRVVAYWKKINDSGWQTVEMTSTDSKIYNGEITGTFTKDDTIRYYIAAQNGNTIRKCAPITGPEGYYEFYLSGSFVDELYGFDPKASIIASIYPNPTTDYLNVVFENVVEGNVMIEVVNSLGQSMSTPVNKYFNKGVFIFDIKELNLNKGVYFLKMTTNSGISIVNFVVQ